jgi:hypothetical protein
MKLKHAKILKIFAAAAALAALLFSVFPASAAGDGVTVKLEAGFDGTVLSGRWNPFLVTLKNSSEKDYSGKIVLSFGRGGWIGSDDETVTVEKDYVLPAGVEKTVTIPVFPDLYGTYGYVDYSLTGVKKTAETSGRLQLNNSRTGNDVFLIGCLSEDPKDALTLGYVNGSDLLKTNTVCVARIHPDGFPSDEHLIDAYDAIVIGDADFSASSSFSQSQIELLKHYILAGGTVVAGTGEHGGKNLDGLSEFFSSDPKTSCVYSGSRNYYSFYSSSKGNVKFSLSDAPYSTVNDASFAVVESDTGENYPLFYRHKSYNLFLTPFSLGNPGISGSTDNQTFLAGNIFEYSGISAKNASPSLDFLSASTRDRSPSGTFLMIGVAAYILLGIIGSFIFFRKKKREKMIWIAIPAAALVFAALFTVYGALRRGGDSMNTVKVVYLSESGKNRAEILSGVYSSGGGRCRVSYEGIDALVPAGSYSDVTRTSLTAPSAVFLGADCGASFAGVTKDTYLYTSASYYDTRYGNLGVVLLSSSDGSEVTVKVSNNTGRDLSDVFVNISGYLIGFGDMKNGEAAERKIDDLIGKLWGSSGADITKSGAALIYEACYEKAGLTGAKYETEAQDVLNGSRYRYYNGSYYYRGRSAGADFSSLKKYPDLYKKACLICDSSSLFSAGTANSYSTAYSPSSFTVWVGGFDEFGDGRVLLNGRTPRDCCSMTFVCRSESFGFDLINISPSQRTISTGNTEPFGLEGDVSFSGGDYVIRPSKETYYAQYLCCLEYEKKSTGYSGDLCFGLTAGKEGDPVPNVYLFNFDTGELTKVNVDEDGACTVQVSSSNALRPMLWGDYYHRSGGAYYDGKELQLDFYYNGINVRADEILSLGDDREIIPVLIRYDKYPDDVSEEFYAPRVSDGEITIGSFYSLPDNSYDYGVAMPYYYTATP